MAEESVSPGVICERFDWGFILTGTREALIRGAHAGDDWFEDGSRPGRKPGSRCRSKYFTHNGRAVRTQQVRGNSYRVFVHFTEVEQREAARAAQVRAEKDALDRALAELPTDAKAYREWLHAVVAPALQAVFLACRSGRGGFRLRIAPHDDEINATIFALSEAIKTAPVEFDASAKASAVLGIRARAAKRDVQLQAFIETQTSTA